MPAFGAKDILIQIDVAGTQTTLTGLRTKNLNINNELVDVTNSDSTARWRQLIAGVGIRSMSISGQGILNANAIDEAALSAVMNGGILSCTVVVPNLGTFTGPFFFQSARYSGDHNQAAVYDITMESADVINKT